MLLFFMMTLTFDEYLLYIQTEMYFIILNYS